MKCKYREKNCLEIFVVSFLSQNCTALYELLSSCHDTTLCYVTIHIRKIIRPTQL